MALFNFSKNFKKRIFTSIILSFLLILMYFYTYILVISLILVSLICWIEFYGLIIRIFKKKNLKDKFLKFLIKSIDKILLTLF